MVDAKLQLSDTVPVKEVVVRRSKSVSRPKSGVNRHVACRQERYDISLGRASWMSTNGCYGLAMTVGYSTTSKDLYGPTQT